MNLTVSAIRCSLKVALHGAVTHDFESTLA